MTTSYWRNVPLAVLPPVCFGLALAAGSAFAQKPDFAEKCPALTDLAASLSAISEKGPDAFYKGAIADAIVKASGAKGGILAKQDFEQYAMRELKPVTCNYRGYEITSSPPPSSWIGSPSPNR